MTSTCGSAASLLRPSACFRFMRGSVHGGSGDGEARRHRPRIFLHHRRHRRAGRSRSG
jgi:hypothetical protein